MSKLTDYGIVLLTHLAREGGPTMQTAQDLAAASKVPLPTVSKILKELCRGGIIISHRGRRGGYSLSRPASSISVAQIVEAFEGPLGLTECANDGGSCSLEETCVARSHWGPISRAIHRTLSRLPLSSLGPRAAPAVGPLPILKEVNA